MQSAKTSLPADWHLDFDESALTRGATYAQEGRITLEKLRPDGLTSRCRGSQGKVYRQTIHWRNGKVFGQCSCPVAYACKHLAAALECYERSTRHGQAAHRTWQQWLSTLPPPEPKSRLLLLRYDLLGDTLIRVSEVRAIRHDYRAFPLSSENLQEFLLDGKSLPAEDRHILQLAMLQEKSLDDDISLADEVGGQILDAMLASGRLFLGFSDRPLVLHEGAPLPARLDWLELGDGSQQAIFRLPERHPVEVLQRVWPPRYLDRASQTLGHLQLDLPIALAKSLGDLPPIPADQLHAFSLALEERFPGVPLPHCLTERRLEGIKPRARLVLSGHKNFAYYSNAVEAFAKLEFRYADLLLDGPGATPNTQEFRQVRPDEIVILQRDAKAELGFHKRLKALGFDNSKRAGETYYELPTREAWVQFVETERQRLLDDHWEIFCTPDFPYDFRPIQSWYATLDEQPEQGWFDLELGIEVEGHRIALLPILLRLIRQHPTRLLELANAEHGTSLPIECHEHRDPNGRPLRVLLPFERLRPILATLGELFMQPPRDRSSLPLGLPDAARLADLELPAGAWQGGERVRAFGERLRQLSGVELQARLPRGLNAELRPYQRQGLAWMQRLGELDVGGLLGDDMGLGKTLQTLAYLLDAKETGKLQHPALIVMPTSLIPNWQDEAARFAPALRVLTLHGVQRREDFKRLAEHDVALTTYALLPRDLEFWRTQRLSILVLDEAQHIKNPASKATQALRNITAEQRLCLSGTPLENHLGELWSLFDFLLPGWLGDRTRFTREYRTPIEKQGDKQRLAHLRARIRPFLLRRTKEEVATELPAKNEMLQWITLSDAQRDRYETVRLAMDAKVRAEIQRQGLARSQLVILEALLKLRQICCDPRLLDTPASQKPIPSAKLEHLLGMLDELVAEGRRILVFSQFTSMLALIEQALAARHLSYVILTGASRDRRTPVARFQAGEVPIFLISLKAGGTGLNLTAADTVIHYDPWWNPAVENQATDRAYRIGQDKAVFVYRLISRGTVEERIQQLQRDKASLVAGILEGAPASELTWQESDIEALFAPLPG